MAKATDNKIAFSLLDVYSNLYFEKYNKKCALNRYRDKWSMLDLVDSVGYDRAKQLIEYYFKISSKTGHSLQWFMYNFDRIDDMLSQVEEDNVKRAKMREATKQMMEGK